MLLAIDVGNTQTVLGVFEGEDLIARWRVATDRHRTADEYGLIVLSFLERAGIARDRLRGIVMASVVPPITRVFADTCRQYLGHSPLQLGPGIKTGLSIKYENPREVGTDRVANAVAGIKLYGPPLIIVDFGTATTFDAIGPQGDYLGGALAPGLAIAAEALYARAAKLPRIELGRPKTAIGRNTVAAMQAGLVFGYAGLVDGLIERFMREMDCQPRVIATGELAAAVEDAATIELIDPDLTLHGLRIIHGMNAD